MVQEDAPWPVVNGSAEECVSFWDASGWFSPKPHFCSSPSREGTGIPAGSEKTSSGDDARSIGATLDVGRGDEAGDGATAALVSGNGAGEKLRKASSAVVVSHETHGFAYFCADLHSVMEARKGSGAASGRPTAVARVARGASAQVAARCCASCADTPVPGTETEDEEDTEATLAKDALAINALTRESVRQHEGSEQAAQTGPGGPGSETEEGNEHEQERPEDAQDEAEEDNTSPRVSGEEVQGGDTSEGEQLEKESGHSAFPGGKVLSRFPTSPRTSSSVSRAGRCLRVKRRLSPLWAASAPFGCAPWRPPPLSPFGLRNSRAVACPRFC